MKQKRPLTRGLFKGGNYGLFVTVQVG